MHRPWTDFDFTLFTDLCWITFKTFNYVMAFFLRMKTHVGFTAFLLLLLVHLPLMLGRKCNGARCKLHENSPIPVNLPRLCGDNIMKFYTKICEDTVWAKRRRRRGNSVKGFRLISYFLPFATSHAHRSHSDLRPHRGKNSRLQWELTELVITTE